MWCRRLNVKENNCNIATFHKRETLLSLHDDQFIGSGSVKQPCGSVQGTVQNHLSDVKSSGKPPTHFTAEFDQNNSWPPPPDAAPCCGRELLLPD